MGNRIWILVCDKLNGWAGSDPLTAQVANLAADAANGGSMTRLACQAVAAALCHGVPAARAAVKKRLAKKQEVK